ncbi:MAG: hypothetical protein LBV07_02195, partial [Syntrophobacterales bacterium]|nr:hypothetical protein [Syntrophobacterales bacterium]
LLKWLWTKDETGKVSLTTSPGFGGILGQCLMEPCGNEKDFPFVLCNAGGGIFNIITGFAFLIPVFFVDSKLLMINFLLVMGLSVIIGAINLIPLQPGGIPNDGSNIREAGKSAGAKRGFYLMLKANAEMSRGKRLADYGSGTFAVSERADINNYFVAHVVLLRSAQLEELGLYEQSYRELLRLNPSQLPPFYGGSVILSLMFHELVYFGDEDSLHHARERIKAKDEDKLFQKFMQTKHPAFLPFHAAKKAFLDGDRDEARKLISQARKLNPSLQNPGVEHSMALMLDKLESRLEDDSQG